MSRWLATLCLLFALAPASAADYRSEANAYRVTIPDGWVKNAEFPAADGEAWESPRVAQTMGFCLVMGEASPETKDLTQLEIDASLAGKFNAVFWREAFGEMKNLDVEAAGEDVQNARRVYYAVMTYEDDEEPVRVKVKAVLHIVPGRMHTVFCAALKDAYGVEQADFETVFKSFRPDGPELVVNVQPFARPVVHRAQLMRAIHSEVRAAAGAAKSAVRPRKLRRR